MILLQRVISLTIVFFLQVRSWTLCAQWTCRIIQTRLLRTSVSRTTCHRLVYSYVPVPVARVLLPLPDVDCRLVSGYLLVFCSSFVLSTRTLTFLAYAFLFRLIDSSPVSLFLDYDSCFPFIAFVLVSRRPLYIWVGDVDLFPIFNLLCNHPKGVTCKIPQTLLVLSSPLAKATALRS